MIIRKRINLRKALFYMSLSIYIVISIINTSMFAKHFSSYYKYVMVFCFMLLFIREAQSKMSKTRLELWFIAMAIIGISLIGNSGANTILTIIMYSVAASDMDFDEMGRVAYRIILAALMFVLFCSRFGIIDDYVYVMAGKPRHYLGFLYALQPAGLTLELVVLNLYLNRKKNKNMGKWIMLALGIYVFTMTKSRLTFFLEVLMFAVDFVYHKKEGIFSNCILLLFEKISYIMGAVASFYLAMTYENALWKQTLNTYLANRLGLAKRSLMKYGVKAFGQKISWAGMGLSQNGKRTLQDVWTGYDWVDNSYIQLFQLYGFIIAIAFIALITVAICYLIKRKYFYLSFIISIYSIYAFIDTASLSLIYNMMWLVIFGSIINIYSEARIPSSMKILVANADNS